jgi:mono/diheme cytochrome c family protein
MSRNQTPSAVTPSNVHSVSNLKSLLNLKTAALSLAVMSLAAAAILWQPHSVAAQAAPAPNTVEFYTQRVLPILDENCYGCHGGTPIRGGLNMTTRASFLKGGRDGVVIVPGDAGQSLLIKLIRHEGSGRPMPPGGDQTKLSDADIATITQWIQAGAVMPPDPPATSPTDPAK